MLLYYPNYFNITSLLLLKYEFWALLTTLKLMLGKLGRVYKMPGIMCHIFQHVLQLTSQLSSICWLTVCFTCDSSTVLSQLMDLDPAFAFLLIDVHHIVVWTHCNLFKEVCIKIVAVTLSKYDVCHS